MKGFGDSMSKNIQELFAKKVIESHLKTHVWINDDGSKDSMFDLGVGNKNNPQYAIECIGVMSQKEVETWNLGPARGPNKWNLIGDWDLQISSNTRVKTIRENLEPFLVKLESQNLPSDFALHVDENLERFDSVLFKNLENLGIVSILQFRSKGEGTVFMSMPGSVGAENMNGDGISEWASNYLSSNKCIDVLHKLSLSSASKREVFMHLIPGEKTPFELVSYFFNHNQVPMQKPNLPKPVTGFWLVCFEFCLYWNGKSWINFEIKK